MIVGPKRVNRQSSLTKCLDFFARCLNRNTVHLNATKDNLKLRRYQASGVSTAVFNVVLLIIVIEALHIETGLGRNIANLACTEVSVLFSFFIYKVFVWRNVCWSVKELILRQIPIYHASVAISFLLRTVVAGG